MQVRECAVGVVSVLHRKERKLLKWIAEVYFPAQAADRRPEQEG